MAHPGAKLQAQRRKIGVEAAGAMCGALLGGALGDRMGLRVAPAASTALALAATAVAFLALRLPGARERPN